MLLMNKLISFLPIALIAIFVLVAPGFVEAADPLVPCEGTTGQECSFCHLIDLGSNVLNWIFGIVFVIFGVITFVAGIKLATSGGVPAARDDAKKKLSNALVGIIIVFSAWLIVDTLMKALITGGDIGDAIGNSELGMWHSIDCSLGTQPRATMTDLPQGEVGYVYENDDGSTQTVIATYSVAVSGPPGNPAWNAYTATCNEGGGGSILRPGSNPQVFECLVYESGD